MTDQNKLEFKNKYENNPVAFVEDFYNVKLYSWQKAYLNALCIKDKVIEYFIPYRYGKTTLLKWQLEYMKVIGMYFNVWTKEGIEVYEKGVLVKIVKIEK